MGNGFEKKKNTNLHNFCDHHFPVLCVCVREREREREVAVVLHLLRRIYPVHFFFFLYVINLEKNRCTTFRLCTIGRLKVKENEKMSPPKYFFLFLMLTSLASSRIKFMYSSKLYKA